MSIKELYAALLWGLASLVFAGGAIYAAVAHGVYTANGATLGIAVCVAMTIREWMQAEEKKYGATADMWGLEKESEE